MNKDQIVRDHLDKLINELMICSNICDQIALVALPTDELPSPPNLTGGDGGTEKIALAKEWIASASQLYLKHSMYLPATSMLVDVQMKLLKLIREVEIAKQALP